MIQPRLRYNQVSQKKLFIKIKLNSLFKNDKGKKKQSQQPKHQKVPSHDSAQTLNNLATVSIPTPDPSIIRNE